MDFLNYSIKDVVKASKKNKGKVFSCFSGGGGSTMGYKLAGFDVVGNCEIDPKMNAIYKANHNPKYNFECDIKDLLEMDLPSELYELDVLDGSPPCSSFSLAGARDKYWGKEKIFREGQKAQVLDTLFFDFIELANKLKPKIVIAENVKGIVQGKAKPYAAKVIESLENLGYRVSYHVLDASKMGVPQKRQRVFFIGIREDIPHLPVLLSFNQKAIPFSVIEDKGDILIEGKIYPSCRKYYEFTERGRSFVDAFILKNGKRGMFSYHRLSYAQVCNTLTAKVGGGEDFHPDICRRLTRGEIIKVSTFPSDFNFLGVNAKYVCGMSVPPKMIFEVVNSVFNHLNKTVCKENI